MPETMRAVDIKDSAGPPSALFINSSIPKPTPSPSECLVRVKAFGLNRADTLQRAGGYPPPPGASTIMGLEFSGVIDTVGQEAGGNNDDWKVGDEVFGLLYGGGYAEYVTVAKQMLIAKPKELSWEYAAGLCEVWFTALQALHLVGGYTSPETTRSILWHAGASSVSIAGIQLSRHLHKSLANGPSSASPPKIYATSRSDEKCEFCRNTLHCNGAVNTRSQENWANEITSLNNNEGVDLVIDYVGAPYFQSNLDVAARDGRIVLLGLLGGPTLPANVNISAFLRKRVRFEGSTLRSRDVAYQSKLRDLFVKLVLPGLLSGQYDHHVDRVLSWEKIQEAHEILERNETMGKVVCLVDT